MNDKVEDIVSLKLSLAALAVTVALGAAQARAETLRMLSSWDESYPAVPVFAQGYAKKVAEASGGALEIGIQGPEVVPPFEQLQPTSVGMFDLLFTHGAYHLGETSMAFGMDAVVDDPQKRRDSGLYDLIDKHYAKHNLKLLGVFSAASGYHVLLREPIGADGGLEGRKVRASGTYHEFITELKGAVVTMPASEIYASLERGVVDGAAWPVFGAMDYKWNEVAKYMTRPTFGVNNHSLFINLDKWNGLTPEQQSWLMEAAKSLEVEGRGEFETIWAKEDQRMVDAGLAKTEFGPAYADKVEAIFARGVWKQVEDKAGDDGKAMHALALEKGVTAE